MKQKLGKLLGIFLIFFSFIPFYIYFNYTAQGSIIWTNIVLKVKTPSLPELSSEDRVKIAMNPITYEDSPAVLVYHGVGGSQAESDTGYSISNQLFAEQLAYLKEAGVQTFSVKEMIDLYKECKAFPPKSVVITFDDGRSEAMMWADPLLKDANFTATMFIIGSAALDPGVFYASTNSLKEYSNSGTWDIQSHSYSTHEVREVNGEKLPELTSLNEGETLIEYRQRIAKDLDDIKDYIDKNLGYESRAFSYPFGAYGADRTNSPYIYGILQEEIAKRFDVAFQQDDQETMSLAKCGVNPFLIRRLEVQPWSGLELLKRLNDLQNN